MRLGIIHYNAPGDTLEAFLDYAVATGFEAIELQCGDVWPKDCDDPEQEAQRVRKLLEERGLVASALGAGNDFVQLDPDAIRVQVKRMERMCSLARILGTHIIRTEGGGHKDAVPPDRELEAMAGCFQRCADFLARDKMYLAIDNHGHVTNDAELQLRLFEMIGSPNVGANMDTMNYRWMGHSVETCNRFYDLIAPHTFHVHMKDGTGSQATYVGNVLGEGEIALGHALAALKKAGYDGTYCAEWEGRGDKAEGYTGCLAWMKEHVKG